MNRGRRIDHRATVAAVGAAALITVSAGPANAADTTTTFTLTAGGLSIAAPASADLGSGSVSSGSVSGSLGTVTVTDNRGALVATWTATASSTDFTTGDETAAETISADEVTYTAGTGTSTPVTTVFTPAVLPPSLGSEATVGTAAGVGTSTTSWNPTIAVQIPDGAVVGTYSGTITHSVS